MARSKRNGRSPVVVGLMLPLTAEDVSALQKMDREAFPEREPLTMEPSQADRVHELIVHAIHASANDNRWDRLFTLQKANAN